MKVPPFNTYLGTEVLRRDDHTCQYCGSRAKELTLDHVLPRHRGGSHVWENVVSACIPCNNRKAGHTSEEAGMKLIRQPFAPRVIGYFVSPDYLRRHSEWQKFLPLWQRAED